MKMVENRRDLFDKIFLLLESEWHLNFFFLENIVYNFFQTATVYKVKRLNINFFL